jgi:lipoprotein NlpI
MQQATCKLKMAKCGWNVIKSDSSYNVWGWKRIKFLLVNMGMKYVKDNIISTSQNNSRLEATKVMVTPLPFSLRRGDIVTKNISLVITW